MDPKPQPSPLRHNLFRLTRVFVILILVVLLLPYLLAPLYRVIDPVSVPMLWRWITGARVARSVVPIARMAPILPATVIAAEDAHFCTHHGVDLGEIREALRDGEEIGVARGASTISQQTAKNLFLWNGRSFVRKALELPLALWIDLVLGKRRLLEIYLNIAEWGPNGEFGADAGARFAFGQSAADVTPHQAALLAAVLPNPHRRSARLPGPSVRRLAGIFEARARRVTAGCAQGRDLVACPGCGAARARTGKIRDPNPFTARASGAPQIRDRPKP
jgi:monofunctional biosynthetic peptidoglycan transglycosylase